MKKKLTFLLTILLSLNFAFGQGFYVEQPITWDYKIIQIDGDTYRIDIIGEFSNEEWHIYDMEQYPNGPISTSLKLNSNEYIELIGSPYISSEIKKAYDSNFKMNIGTTVGDVILSQKIKIKDISKAAATANIEWQACRHSECLPPTDEDITINFNNDQELIAATKINKAATSPEKESNLLGLILEAIAWGLVMLLTPCVFPMVPMTVSFFLKKNQNNKAKGKFYASLFGAFIVALYTIPIAVIILITYFAGGEAITADIFNFLATHWIPNILFFAIFIVFAASFFGAFEIVMPSSLVNKTDSKSDKGGIIGVFFMALTLVLVSFSCTGPIVGTVLIKSTQGEFWEPIVTMLAFSIAFALPFTIFAFSPSLLKNLPKSGGWLNSVKVTLGFIEVALGFKFLSVADQTYHWGLLDREVYLAIWIVCFTLLGLYLLGKLKFKYDSPLEYVTIPRLALAITSFSFVIYMLPGMWGAPLKALSGYLPPITTQDFVINTNPTIGANTYQDSPKNVKYGDFLKLPHNMQGYFDYEEGRAAAIAAGKPMFVDFTGHGCVNCREMEAKVFSDPRIQKLLHEKYIIVALYADDKTIVPEEDWVVTANGTTLKHLGKINSYFAMTKYKVNAQPFYALVDPNTEQFLGEPRGYNLDVEAFIDFLSAKLEAKGY